MGKEKRAFVDAQRKNHEHMVREHKDFIALVNKTKTMNSLGKANGLEDLLAECHQVLSHGNKVAHPVFIELHKFVSGQQNDTSMEEARPWSEKNRDKLKVLQL